jgi:AsmA family protein
MTQISLQSKGLRWLAVFAAALVALLLVIAFFPWDLLRQPINRYVSGQLGRRFEITRHLDVKLGRTTTVIADGVEIANPEWARKAFLLKANSAEFDIRVWPLFFGSVQIPRISLKSPEFGLQAESDGRRSWALARDTSDAGAVPDIGSFLVDQGVLSYIDTAQGADIAAQFSVASEAARDLPLDFKATGKWKGEKFTADGRTGGVLKLSKNVEGSFPLQVNAMVGRTSLKANGTLTDLAELGGVDVSFDLQGKNLDELYKLTGVVLPSTPPYKVRGKLLRKGDAWIASQMQGTLGRSDVSGALTFDQSAEVAMLTGKLQSKLLDFEDLAPVIGLAPAPQAARASKPLPAASAVAPGSAGSQSARAQPTLPASRAPAADRTRKVLPTAVLDLAKLKSMNADVTYSAADIRHVKELPLDEGRIHVLLKNGVLQMDPISLGVAGGSIVGSIKVDSNPAPAVFNALLDVRGAQLNKLFPTVETTKSSLGKISGKFDLNGRGNSAAQMLGGASGDVAILMGRGELRNILLEFMGLDGGEVIKFLVRGDRNVQLRCAAAAFDVKQGVMTSRAIVLDTSDTVINGRGQVSFANETLDLVLDPAPKDFSILSFRSPLRIGGTFAAPNAFPDKGALAGRAGIALALAAINPLLALAATVETGPGEDADCAGVLAEAQKGKASARSASPGLKAVR